MAADPHALASGIMQVLNETVTITGFVAAMMVLVEFANVLSRDRLRLNLGRSGLRQYLLGVALGLPPGCFGSFAAVTLYTHGVISTGAIVATAVATTGDETFAMLALFPEKALLLFAGLAVLALACGYVVDRTPAGAIFAAALSCAQLVVHEEGAPATLSLGGLFSQWRNAGKIRIGVALSLLALIAAAAAGWIGSEEWVGIRITLLIVFSLTLVVVAIATGHFLEEHLWGHMLRAHLPRLFLWTLGAMAGITFLNHYLELQAVIAEGKWLVLVAAALIGLVPESGPHLIFVLLFAKGMLPWSVLVANSIVQDGHGMLPMLAQCPGIFVRLKLFKLVLGLGAGFAMAAAGF